MNMNQQTLTVQLRDFCDLEAGSINLSKLFRISEERHNQIVLRPPSPITKQPTLRGELQARTKLPDKNMEVKVMLPVPPEMDGTTLRTLAPALSPLFRSAATASPNLPEPRKYELSKTKGTISRWHWPATSSLDNLGKEILTLPDFLGRHITAVVLKTLSGHMDDVILHKKGSQWEIVADDCLIDLDDPTQVYRIGPVQVFS